MRPIEARIGSALFFLLAPGTVAGVIPWSITHWRTEPSASHFWSTVGAVLLIPFALILIECFVRFARHNGTPAPVAPPERLVVTGLYRYVRNPMYIAVVGLIFAQLLMFGRAALLAYGVGVFTAFVVFVVFYEEPTLRMSYGEQYKAYCKAVPAWLPRLTPWRSE